MSIRRLKNVFEELLKELLMKENVKAGRKAPCGSHAVSLGLEHREQV